MAAYRNMWKLFGQSTSLQINNSLSRVTWTFTRDYTSRKMEKKLGLPPRPKKPLNPYFIYLINERPSYLKKYPDLTLQEVTKKMSENWKTYDQNEKDKFRLIFKKEMDVYTRNVMEYVQSLTNEQQEAIKEHRARLKKDVEKVEKKKKLKELGKPKRPLPPYALYTQSIVNELGEGIEGREWFKVAAERWSELGQNEKEKFQTMHKELIKKYKVELIEWEAKMIKIGRTDVVRKTVLRDLEGENIENQINASRQAEQFPASRDRFDKDEKLTKAVDSSELAKPGKIRKSQLDKPIQADVSVSVEESKNIENLNKVDEIIKVKKSVEEPVKAEELNEVDALKIVDKINKIDEPVIVEQPKETEKSNVKSSPKSSLWNWWSS